MDNCTHQSDQDFIQPVYELDIDPIWDTLYYSIVMPVAYIGSSLTMLLMSNILYHRRTIPDILVGILAINNFGMVMFVFTPSVIAKVVNHWFGQGVCFMHIVFGKFFVANIFFVIISLSFERYWAICKPFHYQRYSTLKIAMIVIIASTVFCLFFSVVPPHLIPYSVLPGWYCDVVFYRDLSGNNCTLFHDNYDHLLKTYVSLEVIIVCLGISIAGACNMIVVQNLKKKVKENINQIDMDLEKRMINAVILMDWFFFSAWFPIVVSES